MRRAGFRLQVNGSPDGVQFGVWAGVRPGFLRRGLRSFANRSCCELSCPSLRHMKMLDRLYLHSRVMRGTGTNDVRS